MAKPKKNKKNKKKFSYVYAGGAQHGVPSQCGRCEDVEGGQVSFEPKDLYCKPVYFFCKNQFTFQGPVQETCLCKREKEPGHGLIFALQPLTLMLTLTQLCNCELYTCTPTKLAPLNFSHSRTDAEKVQCDDHFQFSLYDESAFFATSHHCRACTRSSSCLSL